MHMRMHQNLRKMPTHHVYLITTTAWLERRVASDLARDTQIAMEAELVALQLR